MLKSLRIRNFALAENLEVIFSDGLSILTGETGAGKSIVVGAIAAVLGERVYTEVIRTGSDKAFVEAVLEVGRLKKLHALLDEKGIDHQGELFIRREISLKGNSRAFVNDTALTISSLAEIGNYLIDIHGQHEHQSLLRKDTHGELLDALGQLQPQLQKVAESYAIVRARESELRQLEQQQATLREKYELYQFQYQEIEKSGLREGETAELEKERQVLMNIEKLAGIARLLNGLFSQDDLNLLTAMGTAEQHLRELGQYADEIKNLVKEFNSARIVVEETARSIETFESGLESDPQRLEEIENRLDLLQRLKKKYGDSISEILNYQQQIKKDLDRQDNFEQEIADCRKAYDAAAGDFNEKARQLSEARKTVAGRLETAVQSELAELGMPRIRFKAALDRVEDPRGLFLENGKTYHADEGGVDKIEFYISANPGEDFKPLSKIASGGEISRIMLALKSILAEIDAVPCLIFDEIDSGVSGRIAQSVGRSIHSLSKSHQILCITHLPQIASQGDHHYQVEKYVENDRTFTRIDRLDDDDRIKAVARLMAGENISDTVLESARQLIAENRR